MEFGATDSGLESGFYQLLDLGAWEVTYKNKSLFSYQYNGDD